MDDLVIPLQYLGTACLGVYSAPWYWSSGGRPSAEGVSSVFALGAMAMKARMKAAKVVAPPKAMKAKKAKKEEQWTKKKNAELQQQKRDNVRLCVEFASIQAVALDWAVNKDAELQRVKRDNERLAAALEGKEAELQRVKRDIERLAAALEWKEAELQRAKMELQRAEMDNSLWLAADFQRLAAALAWKEAELRRVKRDNERLAAALEWKEAELQRAKRDKVQRGAHFVRQARILKRFMQAALVGDKGLSDEPKQPGEGAPDEDLDSEIQAVEQMRGRDGLRALRAKAAAVGVRVRSKEGETWKTLHLEVLRKKVLDRLRWLRWRGLCSHAGSCSGRKRLRSKTKANSSSSSSATTNEQSAKCQKGEGQ